MSEAGGKLPRPPQLRRLLYSSIKKNFIVLGISLSLVASYMKFVHNDGKKALYAEFYKNYDINKEFEIMRKKGLFDSCPSD